MDYKHVLMKNNYVLEIVFLIQGSPQMVPKWSPKSRKHVGKTSETCWNKVGKCQEHVRKMSGKCQERVRKKVGNYCINV